MVRPVGWALHACSWDGSTGWRCTEPARRALRPRFPRSTPSRSTTRTRTSSTRFDVSPATGWTSSSTPSAAPISGNRGRLFVVAGRWSATAFGPRCGATDWLRADRTVVNDSAAPPPSGCISPAAGCCQAGSGRPLQHPDAQAAEAGVLSAGLAHLVRSRSAEEDQASHRGAIPARRGEASAGVARKGRRDRKDSARRRSVVDVFGAH